MSFIYIFMLEHPILYTVLIVTLSGLVWVFIIGLCSAASDADCRMEEHLMELDEFEEKLK